MTDIIALLLFLVAVMVVASTGIFFKPGEWYASLSKPRWCPPDWLFGPAWTVLYVTIAVSGWLVWRSVGFAAAAPAFAIYAAQLVLNAAWSAIFFGARRMDLALAELVLLWLSIAATIFVFLPHHAIAGLLLLPYLAWVTFAGVLNFAMWRLNPGGPELAVR
jgi:tryptophan-rich sensory protein